MTLESPKTHTQKSQEELFNFLSNVDNYKSIMPESLENFKKIDDESFLFQLKGMPEIMLVIKETTPHNQVVLGAKSDKLPFTLIADIEEAQEGSDVQLQFNGEFNAMMGMMIKGPIKKFIATLSENMGKL
ncbi:SRPBCC family protein [Croceibacter atlanticus]|uniref:SRPBCC family protein n=1 Tax=Croceibacter atlanticus TaxID=313588 RepID=UPI002E0F19E6|nr:SRPBCC family protein [Croceibacter atlanticus]|tara:strand:+ start:3175 stop:3564 length:390 start_codon:yes stop_codon:yes gene_type:complete